MNLLEKIQALCNRIDISIYKLEQETGIVKGTIRNWDKSSPSGDKILKVAKFLDTTVESLLDGNDLEDSEQVQVVQKLYDLTYTNVVKWKKFMEIKDNFLNSSFENCMYHYNFLTLTDLINKSERDNMFYLNYLSGGYLLIKIPDENEISYSIQLYVYVNYTFTFYAEYLTLPLINDLYNLVKSKVLGVDNLINKFLKHDFIKDPKSEESI
jgi:transcriptional regulator with XRE-family HTH domain